MTMRAGLYGRISEHDEKVAKVENQLKDCHDLVERRGYVLAGEYEDEVSATSGKVRKGFERLLRDVESGKLDVIVAVDEDRLSRRMDDTLRLQAVSAAAGVVWDTVRGGMVDPTKAQGEAFSQIRAVMSRLEVRQKVDRQRAANRHRRMSGKPMTGTRPFGFEKDRVTHRRDEADEIAWAYATVISTGKLYPVLKDWNSRGVLTSRIRDWKERLALPQADPTDDRETAERAKMSAAVERADERGCWSYATLQQLLRRASNAGLVEHDGQVLDDVEAQWEPIVSRDDWQAVVAILSDPNRRVAANREPKHLLAGLATCGTCGSVMRSSGSTNKPGEKIYRCATKISAQGDGRRHASVRITDLDPIVRKAVIDTYFVSSPGGLPSHDEDVVELGRLHTRLSEVRQAIAELFDSFGQPGYTKARIDVAVAKLSGEESELVAKVEAHARQSAHAAMLVDTFALMVPKGGKVSFADSGKHKDALAARFDSLSLEQRRTLVRSLVRVTVHGGRSLEERVDVEHVGAPVLDVEGDPWCA